MGNFLLQGYCITCQQHFNNCKGLHEHLTSTDGHRVGYVDAPDATSRENAIANGLDEFVLKKIWDLQRTSQN
jgi:hypothetical protein